MFLRFFSLFFIKEPFERFFVLDLFHGVFIDYIYDLCLASVFFCMFKHRYQGKYKSQKEEKLDEIIRPRKLDGLGAYAYDTDSITYS